MKRRMITTPCAVRFYINRQLAYSNIKYLLLVIFQTREIRHSHELTKPENADLAIVKSDEAIRVVDPLTNEVLDQRSLNAGHRAVLQCVEEERCIVVHRCDGNLRRAKYRSVSHFVKLNNETPLNNDDLYFMQSILHICFLIKSFEKKVFLMTHNVMYYTFKGDNYAKKRSASVL